MALTAGLALIRLGRHDHCTAASCTAQHARKHVRSTAGARSVVYDLMPAQHASCPFCQLRWNHERLCLLGYTANALACVVKEWSGFPAYRHGKPTLIRWVSDDHTYGCPTPCTRTAGTARYLLGVQFFCQLP